MTNEEFILTLKVMRIAVKEKDLAMVMRLIEYAEKLVAVAETLKNERTDHTDCYCDCNAGSCPCLPCSARIAITDLALENLERE